MAKKTIDPLKIREELQSLSDETVVYIGVDSQRFKKKGKWYARYVKCVVIHKDGKHGGSLYRDIVDVEDYGGTDPSTRLMKEAEFIIELYEEIKDVVSYGNIRIHVDVNSDPTAKSHSVMRPVVGWIYGVTGINPEVKPNAWCATHAADEYCR